MPLTKCFRSLLAQSVLWIILPLFVVIIGILITSTLTYQQVVASLLIDRDRQLAIFSAERVSQTLNDYAFALKAAYQMDMREVQFTEMVNINLDPSPEILKLFSAGVIIVDEHGEVLASTPQDVEPIGSHVDQQTYFIRTREEKTPIFSDVLIDKRTGEDMVVLAVPILNEQQEFKGALLGAIHLHTTSLSDPILKLSVGDEGFAYLVDSHGRAIFYPDPNEIGADFSDRQAVTKVIAGESGGMLWNSPTGERLVLGYAPVEGIGWGLVVREPWEAVIEPVQIYETAVGVTVSIALMIAVFLLWRGGLRITLPIRSLVTQISHLAAGEKTEPIPPSGILEVDTLAQAFDQMTARIHSYRAGLRRYVGAITSSQEEERKRIARELHDETVQNLVAILRQIELHQTTEDSPKQLEQLQELQRMVEETIRGVRQISRDLRPLALEDLGFVPALESQLQLTRKDGLSAQLEILGKPYPLPPEIELALYRIAQEALSNARQHAHALNLRAKLTFDDAFVQLEVYDDGIGFTPPASLNELAQHGSFGLMGIQERVGAVGGRLEISSEPAGGTHISVLIPKPGNSVSS
jgi:signal transduction histidine kinase